MLITAAQPSASAAPWWGVGVFTLAGAVIAGGFTWFNDRRKDQREELRGNETIAREATVHFLYEVHGAYIHMRDRGRPYKSGSVNVAWAGLQVAADRKVVERGREYLNALNTVACSVRKHGRMLDEMRSEYGPARDAFVETVRSQHGLEPIPALHGVPMHPLSKDRIEEVDPEDQHE